MMITMNDIVHRRHLNTEHRAYVPDFEVYIKDYDAKGNEKYHLLSRQMILFCVERRKSWRLLQSKAGVQNKDYFAQKEMIGKIDKGELTLEEAYGSIEVL